MFNKIKDFFTHKDRDLRDNRWIFASMLVGACLSLLAAFNLSIDAISFAANPNYQPGCAINAIINCAAVAQSSYATLFGFPNSFLGMIAEPVVITVAIAGLIGIKFPRLFMFAAQIGYSLGFIFAYYLFFSGIFYIGALCPWCLLVTFSTTFVWFSITRYNIREENLFLSKKISDKAKAFIQKDYDKLVLAMIVVAVVALILVNYGSDLFA